MSDRVALSHGQHGFFEIRFGFGDVALVRGGNAVDAAHVLQSSIPVDDEQVWRGLRAIQSADRSRRIQQHRCGCSPARLGQRVSAGSVDVTLVARCRGNHAQPDHAILLREFLQPLHVAAGVVLAREGAVGVGPLQDDGLATELAQGDRTALAVRGSEIGRRPRLPSFQTRSRITQTPRPERERQDGNEGYATYAGFAVGCSSVVLRYTRSRGNVLCPLVGHARVSAETRVHNTNLLVAVTGPGFPNRRQVPRQDCTFHDRAAGSVDATVDCRTYPRGYGHDPRLPGTFTRTPLQYAPRRKSSGFSVMRFGTEYGVIVIGGGHAGTEAGIQFRTLNASKGPAVRATRAQADRQLYKQAIRRMLETQPNLTLFQQEVADLKIEGGRVVGVVTQSGIEFRARAVVLTVGTFLGGRIHVGLESHPGGRAGDPP